MIQKALDDRTSAIELESLDNAMLLYFADCIFPLRKRAEGVASRIEDFTPECSLSGRADLGTASARAAQLIDGRWMVKIDI